MKDSGGEYLVSASHLGETVESLWRDTHRSPMLLWMILLLLGAGLGSLPFIRMAVWTSSPGFVRPAIERVELRSARDGWVEQTFVTENQVVQQGDSLFVLRATEAAERRNQNQELVERLQMQVADLDAVLRLTIDPTRVATVKPGAAILPALTLATGWINAEYNLYRVEVEAEHHALLAAVAKRERIRSLADKGLVSEVDREAADLEVDRSTSRILALHGRTVSGWQAKRRAETTALEEAIAAGRTLDEYLAASIVKAPMDGWIVESQNLLPGSYVSPGQVLAVLGPSSELVVEAHVRAKDTGHITIGQSAVVEVTAFPLQQWGVLKGVVRSISADAVGGERSDTFIVRVTIQEPELTGPRGERGVVRQGHQAIVRFMVGGRSLLDLLYEGFDTGYGLFATGRKSRELAAFRG